VCILLDCDGRNAAGGKLHIEKEKERKENTMKGKMLKVILSGIVLTTLTIALGGCAGDKAGDTSSSDSSIVIGIPQDLEDSLDPHEAKAAGTKEVLFNVFEGLLKPDSEGNLNPAVASDYSISEDGKTYTFNLREGILFHDKTPVTVKDVKYSIEKCADAGNGDALGLAEAFSNIEAINTPDDKTVEIVLKEVDTDFLSYMTVAVIPEANKDPRTNPIGTGPYKYVSRSPQENIVVERFDEYWGDAAHIKDVTFKITPAESIVMDLEGGSIDMYARIPSEQAVQLSDKFNIEEGTMNLVQALYLNNDNEYFSNKAVRQALCYAVDEQAALDLTSDGKGTVIGSSMFPAFGKYYMEELSELYPHDVERAKELLKEAGYPDGFEFTLKVPSNYPQHVSMAQVLKEQLKEIGVTVNIEQIEWNSWLSDVYTDRQFDATVVGVDAASLTARALLERFYSSSDKNFINFNSPAYDTAFDHAIGTTDDEEQVKYYKECEQILAEEAANVYIQDMASFVALNKKYAGYEFYPLYVLDVAKLYIVED